jgi:hypothetical protein
MNATSESPFNYTRMQTTPFKNNHDNAGLKLRLRLFFFFFFFFFWMNFYSGAVD